MSGHKNFNILLDKLLANPESKKRFYAKKAALDTALALDEIRRNRQTTQVELAQTLRLSQATISQMENNRDVYLSTLRRYIEALGGRLEVQAVFPDVTLSLDPMLGKSNKPAA